MRKALAFMLILLIAALLTRLLKYAGVKAILSSIRPAIAGMILATAVTMFLSVLIGLSSVKDSISVDPFALLIFALIVLADVLYSVWKGKKISPIILIVLSAVLGVLFYGI